ncbi:restriction endonuclease subunit S [Streptomyces sp. NPDC057748]|uniref:restriction endonuclease subunit S n=1 Tax=unclassified Streptomyces TaxID=2593676 RepID=UPI0036A19DFE
MTEVSGNRLSEGSPVCWPSDWRTAPLWSMFERVKDVEHPHEELLSVYREHGVVKREGRDDNYNKAALDRSIYQLVHPGWLVVNRMKAWQGSVGISPYRGIVSGHYICFRPKHNEDHRFLNWLFRSAVYAAEYASLSRGVRPNQVEIDNEWLRALQVKLPPLEEQRRIADFLDAEIARIDKLDGLRKVQELNLAERRYASVSEILLPGILTDPSGLWPWTWLPRATNNRPFVRLGYVCRLQNGLTVDGKREIFGDAVTRPYLRVANVQAGSVALETVTEITVPRTVADRSTLRPGDVLMTEGGDLDKLGRGTVWRGELPNCLHQNHVFALRPEQDRLDGDYLALMTRTLHGRCYFESTGTKTTNLASTNSSKILSFPIPLPNVATQRELAQQAQKALEAAEAASRLLNHQRSLLTERRQALITAAVTGQFDVSTASGRNVTDGAQA